MSSRLCNLLCTRDGTAKLVFVWYIGYPVLMLAVFDSSSWIGAAIFVVSFIAVPISFNSWREKYCKNRCAETEYISKWDPDSPDYFVGQMQRDAEAKELGVSPLEYDLHQMLLDEAMKHIKNTEIEKSKFLESIEGAAKKAVKDNPDISIEEWLLDVERILKKVKNENNS